ncbi:MAG: hypothetical protein O7G85_01980 [Planctomycetota bacterium]|nr:hypothetical protein [Planctomycetota bacterium]
MTGTVSTDWIWHGAGIALGVIAMGMLYWSLFHDRARGRKRCPKCWYDLQGAEADANGTFHCPECGKGIKHERKLRKTRRRWRWVCVALLLVPGAGFLGVHPKVKRDGWLSFTPTCVLIMTFPYYERGYRSQDWRQDCYDLLCDRVRKFEDLAVWNKHLMFRVIIPRQVSYARRRLDSFSKKYSPEQISDRLRFSSSSSNRYSRVTSSLLPKTDDHFVFREKYWTSLTDAFPLFAHLKPHPEWPEDLPISWHISLFPLVGFPGFEMRKVVVSASLIDPSQESTWLPKDAIAYYEHGYGSDFILLEAPATAPPPGEYDIRFEVKVFSQLLPILKPDSVEDRTESNYSSHPYSSHTLTTRMVVGGTVDDILSPDESSETSERLLEAIRDIDFIHCRSQRSGQDSGNTLVFSIDSWKLDELRKHSTVIPRLQISNTNKELTYDMNGDYSATYRRSRLEIPFAFNLPVATDSPWRSAQPGERWTMRIYGSGEDAIREIDAGSYWAGSFEFDVDLHALMNCESFENARFDD